MEDHLPDVALEHSIERHPSTQPLPLSLQAAIARIERWANHDRKTVPAWLQALPDSEFAQVVDMVHAEYLRRLSQDGGYRPY